MSPPAQFLWSSRNYKCLTLLCTTVLWGPQWQLHTQHSHKNYMDSIQFVCKPIICIALACPIKHWITRMNPVGPTIHLSAKDHIIINVRKYTEISVRLKEFICSRDFLCLLLCCLGDPAKVKTIACKFLMTTWTSAASKETWGWTFLKTGKLYFKSQSYELHLFKI